MIQPFEDLTRLLSLIHTGDWEQTPQAAAALQSGPVPADPSELAEYRRRVLDALLVARAARANLASDLRRLQAAQRFTSAYQIETAVPERSPGRV